MNKLYVILLLGALISVSGCVQEKIAEKVVEEANVPWLEIESFSGSSNLDTESFTIDKPLPWRVKLENKGGGQEEKNVLLEIYQIHESGATIIQTRDNIDRIGSVYTRVSKKEGTYYLHIEANGTNWVAIVEQREKDYNQ